MFVPITSEVNISTGMMLKEIATDHLFEVSERLAKAPEIWGEDTWRIVETAPADPYQHVFTLSRRELAQKYLADVEE